jgi:hypothetical protein
MRGAVANQRPFLFQLAQKGGLSALPDSDISSCMPGWDWRQNRCRGKQTFFLCLILAAACVVAYYSVHVHPFSQLDDYIYVTQTPTFRVD